MESSKFYGKNRSRVPLYATAIAEVDVGVSDDQNLSHSDDEYVSGSQQVDIYEKVILTMNQERFFFDMP